MRNKITKSFLVSVLALAMVAPTASCGSEKQSTATIIKVVNYGGGIGRAWLDEAIVRFKEEVKDKSYEAGKMGVEFSITHNISATFKDIEGSGDHLYFTHSSNFRELIQKGSIYEINDVVKAVVDNRNGTNVTIEDKIPEEYRYQFMGNDGNYYALPYYEYYDGLTYDADLFDKYGLYLADPADEPYIYDCELIGQSVALVANSGARKACGNDGQYGTEDDGLPTSLYEMIALCDYMKEEAGVTPFTVSGKLLRYSNKLLNGLWAGLAGHDDMYAAFSMDGTVDYVTGFSNDNLFAGVDTIKAPIIEQDAKVTMATGYKAVNQAARYYAGAFMELAQKQGWIDTRSTQGSFTHKDAMRALVLSGIGNNPETAMLIEGTYWYNEAMGYGLFEEYATYTGKKDAVRNVKYFNMPTSLNETVTEGNGRAEALAEASSVYSAINGNLKGKEDQKGIVDACKDFLKFLFTDAELQNFTKSTGARKGVMDYEIEPILSSLDPFKKSVMTVSGANADSIVRQAANNDLFLNNSGLLTWGDSAGWLPEFDGLDSYNCFLNAFRAGKTAAQCFISTGYTESSWAAVFSQYID